MENIKNIIVITGGSGGIGQYIVKKYLENNNIVINMDVNAIEDKNITSNDNYKFLKTDVKSVDSIIEAKNYIQKKYGYINHIISAAGINCKSEIEGIETLKMEDIDEYIKLNLNAHIYLTKIMLPLIKESKQLERRTITYISSINAIRGYGLPVYSAGKSGIYGFMRAIVKELGKYSIRVNTISLGTVPHYGEKTEGVEYFENYKKSIALEEFVLPKDVAELTYSITHIIQKLTGQNIVLDAGQSI